MIVSICYLSNLKFRGKLENHESVFTIKIVFLYLMIIIGFLIKTIENRLDKSNQVTDFVYQQF